MYRLVLTVILFFPLTALAIVEGYTVEYQDDGGLTVSSVSVGANEVPIIYNGDELIQARIIHYASGGGVCIALPAGRDLETVDRSMLLGALLNCGTPNPGAMPTPESGAQGPGVAVRFESPVVNRTGDDVVVFEMHKGAGTGDPFHIAPLSISEELYGITVDHYDIAPGHPSAVMSGELGLYRAAGKLNSLEELANASIGTHAGSESGFIVLAVGIDFSDFGYAEGQ